MGQYASQTDVSTDKSVGEVRSTLRKYGATGFLFGEHDDPPRAFLEFEMNHRRVRFVVPMPTRDQFRLNSYGNVRPPSAIAKDHEQAIRQKWRALALVVKAKLVAVEDGIVSFEQEFAMHFVLPSGVTIFEALEPQLPQLCESGNLPKMLPG